jgi:hypothetical protein
VTWVDLEVGPGELNSVDSFALSGFRCSSERGPRYGLHTCTQDQYIRLCRVAVLLHRDNARFSDLRM